MLHFFDLLDDQKYSGKLKDDIYGKLRFDLENYEPVVSFNHNGAHIELCCAGGDWEFPIYFALYHDGSTMRAYIPRIGNLFNINTNEALGNSRDEAEDDFENVKSWAKTNNFTIPTTATHWGEIRCHETLADCAVLIEEIKKRIVVK